MVSLKGTLTNDFESDPTLRATLSAKESVLAKSV